MDNWIERPIVNYKEQAATLFNLIKDTGAFVAGSFPLSLISGAPAGDVDVFTGNWDTFFAVQKAFKDLQYLGETNIAAEYRGCNLEQKISVIKPIDNEIAEEVYGSTKVAGTKEEILDSFDLYLSECVLKDEETVLISALCQHNLDFNCIIFKSLDKPRRALIRAFKYANKGFRISEADIDRLLVAIREFKIAV